MRVAIRIILVWICFSALICLSLFALQCKSGSEKVNQAVQKTSPPEPREKLLCTLTADVTVNRVSGGFAERGKNCELDPGTYTFKLVNSTVRYGQGQRVSEIVLLRMNMETKDAYLTLNGIGDTKTVNVPTGVSLSVFFAPGEPTYDDQGTATVEVFRRE
jgi:hypothetical protein